MHLDVYNVFFKQQHGRNDQTNSKEEVADIERASKDNPLSEHVPGSKTELLLNSDKKDVASSVEKVASSVEKGPENVTTKDNQQSNKRKDPEVKITHDQELFTETDRNTKRKEKLVIKIKGSASQMKAQKSFKRKSNLNNDTCKNENSMSKTSFHTVKNEVRIGSDKEDKQSLECEMSNNPDEEQKQHSESTATEKEVNNGESPDIEEESGSFYAETNLCDEFVNPPPNLTAENAPSKNDSTNEINFSEKFEFVLTEKEWSEIKPEVKVYGGKGRTVRRLQNNWTDIFSEKAKMYHPGCVLTFKTHHVKAVKSRKVFSSFLIATAYCRGIHCRGKYVFTILNEPSEAPVTVYCSLKGPLCHKQDEVNRRNITGEKRDDLAKEIRNSSAANVFNENLTKANTEEMENGNFTSVPNPTVLRKIVSELVHKEYLHNNILYELQLLKENDEKLNIPYIREIGLDPFTLIMFSDTQIQLMKQLSNEDSLDLYIDATGGIIRPIQGQKRPYLYSVIVKPGPAALPVSVGDMISTQHTIPRIELFLNTLKRAASGSGSSLKIRKIETDFSFALIQACLRSTNSMTIKTYVQRCFDIVASRKKDKNINFTLHHLCSSHLIKDFIRKLKKLKCSINKRVKTFMLQCFVALQNSASLDEAIQHYRHICRVFLSQGTTDSVTSSVKYLQKIFKSELNDYDDHEEVELPDQNPLSLEVETLQHQTIKAASPFTQLFSKITNEIRTEIKSDKNTPIPNEYFCQELVRCLEDNYMPILPLWSGIVLSEIKVEDGTVLSRDTNSPVENWFKYLKVDLAKGDRDRPSKFVILLKTAIESRLLLKMFPGATQKKTKGKRKCVTDDNQREEEKWRRGAKKRKKNLYQSYPPRRKTVKTYETPEETAQNLPKVMRWGGSLKETNLTNTCTIDNGLTILHLFHTQNNDFNTFLSNERGETCHTLLTVLQLMNNGDFTQAKLVWASSSGTNVTNLYGDEFDYFMGLFDREWKSKTVSRCDGESCPEPLKESREGTGINIGSVYLGN